MIRLYVIPLLTFCCSVMCAQTTESVIDEVTRNTRFAEADSLYKAAETAYNEQRLNDAYTGFIQSAQIRMQLNDTTSVEFADALQGYIICYMSLGGESANCVEMAENALSIYQKQLGNESLECQEVKLLLGIIYSGVGEYEKGLALHREAMAIKYKDGKSMAYIYDLYYEQEMLLRINRIEEARAVEDEMTSIASDNDASGMTSLSLMIALSNTYSKCNKRDQSLALVQRAMDFARNNWGENSQQYAWALSNRADVMMDIRSDEENESDYLQAIQILRDLQQCGTSTYLNALYCIASHYYDNRRYSDALLYGLEYWGRMSSSLGNNDNVMFEMLSAAYSYTGQYEKQKAFIEERIAFLKQNFDEAHPYYLTLIPSLAQCYRDLGEENLAHNMLVECALEASDHNLKKTGINCAITICKWGIMQAGVNGLTMMPENILPCNKVLEKALLDATEMNDIISRFQLLCLKETLLANLIIDKESLASVAEYFPNIEELLTSTSSEIDSILLLPEMLYLDEELSTMREYHKSLPAYIDFGVKFMHSIPDDFSLRDSSVLNLQDRYVSNYQLQVAPLLQNFRNMSSSERAYYVNKLKDTMEDLIAGYGMERYTGNRFDAALLYRGLLLQSDISINKLIVESGDEQLLNLFYSMRNNQATLKRLCESGQGTTQEIDSLKSVIEHQDKEIVLRCKAYKDFTESFQTTWQNVRDVLKPGEIVLETYTVNNADTTQHKGNAFAALALRSEWNTPRDVILFREDTAHPDSIYTSDKMAGQMLRLMKDELEGIHTIFFVADGKLNSIAFENLVADSLGTRLCEKYNIYRLSSSRELVFRKIRGDGDVVLYGGVEFDAPFDNQPPPVAITSAVMPSRLHRAVTPGITVRGAMETLPATLEEVEALNDILESSGVETTIYKGLKATEESFHALSGKQTSALHLATHGFYWNEEQASGLTNRVSFLRGARDISSMLGTKRIVVKEDDALVRNGLLLCSANNTMRGETVPDDREDGILTALEISRLDLRGLDLVTLSACETGLGDITGDGVFGLQRGFKKAGANSILMSLWKVDDEATCKLMTEFYSNWIGKKMTKHDALEAAKRTVRETKGWEDPKYWSAFILLDGLD